MQMKSETAMKVTREGKGRAGVVPEKSLPLTDIIGWDVPNWSKCLPFWQEWLAPLDRDQARIPVLGERNGGISLWFALLGFKVICSDYRPMDERVRDLHRHWGIEGRVEYAVADVFKLGYPDDQFDVWLANP